MARTIAYSTVLAAKRQVWQRMTQRVIRPRIYGQTAKLFGCAAKSFLAFRHHIVIIKRKGNKIRKDPSESKTDLFSIGSSEFGIRKYSRTVFDRRRREPCKRLAAIAIPGPASRRPDNGAAAEIAALLFLPQAAGALQTPCGARKTVRAYADPCSFRPQAATGRRP